MEEDLSADGWLGKEGGEGKVSKEEKINMSHMCKYMSTRGLSDCETKDSLVSGLVNQDLAVILSSRTCALSIRWYD